MSWMVLTGNAELLHDGYNKGFSPKNDFNIDKINFSNNINLVSNRNGTSGTVLYGDMSTISMVPNTENTADNIKLMSFEDAFRFDFDEINKGDATSPFMMYFTYFSSAASQRIDTGLVKNDGGKQVIDTDEKSDRNVEHTVFEAPVAPSMFNPYFSVHINGITENVPLITNLNENDENINGSVTKLGDKTTKETPYTFKVGEKVSDTSDCSIKKLVELSKTTGGRREIGGAGYRYADFMYCKDLGKIPNNHLITLRRFAHPVSDNITSAVTDTDDLMNGKDANNAPDMCRLVTWFNEDNHMEDILNYSFNASWKEFNAEIQQLNSQEDSEERGIIGSVVNLANPSYRTAVSGGKAGSGNRILGSVERVSGGLLKASGQYENSDILSNYDQHKIYTPQNTVQNTHKYEGKLNFQHEFTLVFNYELKGYQNINPKSAMLDLLANVTEVTYNHGHFWGGAQKIVGAPANRKGWQKAMDFVDQAWGKIGGFLDSIMTGTCDWSIISGAISNAMSLGEDMFNKAKDDANSMFNGGKPENATEGAKKIYTYLKDNGAGSVLKGMLLNKLGRPAMYAFDSLLTGDPVGVWHVTLGNPRNPIMSIGNLIITNTSVQQYGRLGIDDFPTGLRVTVGLKHAKSRDAVEITQMYTKGQRAIYMPLDFRKFNNYYDIGNIEKGKKKNETTTVKTTDSKTKKTTEETVNANQAAAVSHASKSLLTETSQTSQIFGTRLTDQIIFNLASR